MPTGRAQRPTRDRLLLLVAVGVGQQGQVTGALDGGGQFALVAGLGAGDTAGHDLTGLGDVALQGLEILVIDLGSTLGGKTAELAATIETLLHGLFLSGLVGFIFIIARLFGFLGGLGGALGLTALAAFLLCALGALGLHDVGVSSLGFVALDDQVAQQSVVVAEVGGQLIKDVLAALAVHEYVVGLVDLLARVGELTTAPILQSVDLAAGGVDELGLPVDHPRNLFTLVRVDHKDYFIVAH